MSYIQNSSSAAYKPWCKLTDKLQVKSHQSPRRDCAETCWLATYQGLPKTESCASVITGQPRVSHPSTYSSVTGNPLTVQQALAQEPVCCWTAHILRLTDVVSKHRRSHDALDPTLEPRFLMLFSARPCLRLAAADKPDPSAAMLLYGFVTPPVLVGSICPAPARTLGREGSRGVVECRWSSLTVLDSTY